MAISGKQVRVNTGVLQPAITPILIQKDSEVELFPSKRGGPLKVADSLGYFPILIAWLNSLDCEL